MQHSVTVILTDTLNSTNATFKVKVTNSEPYFESDKPQN